MSLVIAPELVPLSSDADGVIRIGSTRVTLDSVVVAFHEDLSAEAIAERYPSLQLAEVYAVVGYYLNHKVEVDAYLREREAKAADVRRENEFRFNAMGVRERLLARRKP